MSLDTPVVLLVFNRPETTRRVLRALAESKPTKLLVIGDGPRESRPEEIELCAEVRAMFNRLDWPCDVLTNFASSNLGCQERVVSGLTWAFSQVEEAIILEDDCVPDPTFFPFCQELLERYRGDSRVGMITGNNFIAPKRVASYDYYFSRVATIWGWATWRSAWERFDRYLHDWPMVKHDGVLREIYSRDAEFVYWTNIFDSMHDRKGPSSWAYPWFYTNLINNMLCIVPSNNLVRNIGFGGKATHTHDPRSEGADLAAKPMTFPIKHPPYMIAMKSFDDFLQRTAYVPTFSHKIYQKILRVKRQTLGAQV
jgi:hypothetical protein